MMKASPILTALLATVLAACAGAPVPRVQREAQTVGTAGVAGTGAQPAPAGTRAEAAPSGPRAVIRRGSGSPVRQTVTGETPPPLTGGGSRLNFEAAPLQAVVAAILGDMLGQSYSIAPGIGGTVTLSTQRPVSAAEAMAQLEMVLAQNNARMVYSGGRYNIVPADQALTVGGAPRNAPVGAVRGFESRVFTLRHISAAEMEKILKPYARAGSIVYVDGARNLITLAGTRTELENYQRTIQTFDVDWLAGMSVGVFPLQTARAAQVVQDLDKIFGEQSKSPVAGMFRFMPLDTTNAVMVITSQPDYLDDIQQWISRIEGGTGEELQLYTYELKYIKARELATRLGEVFGLPANASAAPGQTQPGARIIPGAQQAQLFGQAMRGQVGPQLGGNTLAPAEEGNTRVEIDVSGARVGVAAVEETNSLLVRATPGAWRSIREVIERLDVMPMQVHIEAQIAEVALSGDLKYGVSWFFQNAISEEAGLPYPTGRNSWGSHGASIAPVPNFGNVLSWTFLGRNAAAIVQALDSVTDVRILQSPSIFVRNNQEATLNVGERIPITTVSINPMLGNNNTYNQVQYLDTGVILRVRPRITREGTVFLEVIQEVSQPKGTPNPETGNVNVATSQLQTEVAVQSGDTVLLGGLINDSTTRGASGVPGLSRIPVIGGLFGVQSNTSRRAETIVLITANIVRNPQEVRDLTDEYTRRFRAMEPLNKGRR